MHAKIAESGQVALPYVAPRWLPGGQLQTIWPALYARRVHGPALPYRRERWTTPDADFVDVDYLDDGAPPGVQRPLLVVFHGLEGSSRSHYGEAFADVARERGWACALPHFRGCSVKSTGRHVPTIQATMKRSAGCWNACAVPIEVR